MKKFICLICCFALLALGISLPGAKRLLPYAGRTDKSAGYAGVVRLWVYEDLSFLSAWLRRCCDQFERAHSGVYVYVKWVSEAEMRMCATGETDGPDAVIFPSGMLPSSNGLAEITSPAPYASLNGYSHALPVAMSGYLFCENAAHAASDLSASPLICPEDGPHTSYAAALISLCAQYEDQTAAPTRPGEGMELGLPTPVPTAFSSAPVPVTRLPSALARNDAACSLLASGEAKCILVSRRAYATLSALSQAGRSVEYTLSSPGAPLTDQVYWVSVPLNSNAHRQETALSLAHFLLTDKSQSQLALSGAFRTTPGVPLYDAASGMAPLEAALSDSALMAAPAFGDAWRETAKELWNRCFSGEIDAWTARKQLKNALFLLEIH